MEKAETNKKRLIYVLVIAFCIMGILTYLVVKDTVNKTIESNALLVANVIVGQSKVSRKVYVREVVNKLRNDGAGSHPDYKNMHGYVPIPALFQRMLSDEASTLIKDIQYQPISKWNLGPYGIGHDPFLIWGWQQLEQQEQKNPQHLDENFSWQPVWRIEKTDSGDVLRYLDAIPASSPTCLGCHQKYESTRAVKKMRAMAGDEPHEYKLHHLMGALSVTIPLTSVQELAESHLNQFIIWIIGILLVSFIAVLWFSTHSLLQLKDLSSLSLQARQDPLTGLLNRRGFNLALEHHLKLLDSEESFFSLCVFDLDGFKSVNDVYGHQAGDEMLREIARVLHKTFRESDVLIRLGGDEFAVILAGCHINQADILCHKLLKNIQAIKLEWEDSELAIGASIGVYECQKSDMSTEDILQHADNACYAAKENGKNQVKLSSTGN